MNIYIQPPRLIQDILKYSGILFCLLLFKGCTSDDYMTETDKLLKENVQALVSPRTMVAVSKCVDAYVDVGGYETFKGTHCWTELVEGGDIGDFIYIGIEYDPGMLNPNGGGNYGPKGNPSQFSFTYLTTYYAPGSSLNLNEKMKLENALNTVLSFSTVFTQMMEMLTENNIKFKFYIDKEACEKLEANAFFDKRSGSICFKDSESIKCENILEELVHAAQFQLYGDIMGQSSKNCEFEAKVFLDLVNELTNTGIGYTNNIPTMTDKNPVFIEEYLSWKKDIVKVRCFTNPEVVEFQRLCNLWKGYEGTYMPNFRPLLLDRYFRKPIPAHM